MHIYRCNPFERETHSGHAYWWLNTPIASKFHRDEDRNRANEGGEEEMSFVLTHERKGGARRTQWEVVEHQTLTVMKQLHI